MSKALWGMVVFGCGEVVWGFIHGIIIDKIGSRKTVYVNTLIMFIMALTAILSVWNNKFDWLSFLMCFLWGCNDSAVNVYIYQVNGFEFENASDPFAVWNVLMGLSNFVG